MTKTDKIRKHISDNRLKEFTRHSFVNIISGDSLTRTLARMETGGEIVKLREHKGCNVYSSLKLKEVGEKFVNRIKRTATSGEKKDNFTADAWKDIYREFWNPPNISGTPRVIAQQWND